MRLTAGGRDSAWALLGQVAGAGASLGRGILVARLTSPDDLGRLFLITSAGALIAGVGQTGVAVAGLRRMSASESASETAAHIHAAVTVTAVVTLMVVGVGDAALAAFHVSGAVVLAFTLLATAQLWLGLLAALWRGLQRVATAVRHEQVIAPLLQCAVLAMCLLIKPRWSLASLVAVLAAALLPSIGRLAGPLRGAMRQPSREAAAAARGSLIAESIPVLLNSALWRALADLPVWAAGIWTGAAGTALLGVAQRSAGVLQMPLAAAATAVAPRAAALSARGATRELERQLRAAADWATAASVLGLLLIVAFGRLILRTVFGPFYEGAFSIAVVLGVGQVINAAAGLGGTTLLMIGRARTLLVISLISSLVLAILVMVGGAKWGLPGLAWAWVAGFTIQNVLMVAAVRRQGGVRTYVGWP